MNVLSISGDVHAVTEGSEAHTRMHLLRSMVDAFDVFVWPQKHSVRDLVRAVRKKTYHVVTTQDPFWRGLVAWLLARTYGARLNVQVHADLSGSSRLRRVVSGFVLRRADSIRVVSSTVHAQVERLGASAPVHVLPMYLDLARFRNVERVAHTRPTILWIGRFELEKDPMRAIQVLKEVRAKGDDVVLVMLGAGRLESALRKAAKNLPVEFPGWHPPEAYLAVADVVLSTSEHESWGASIIEALAAGVPVVAPDVGVAKEAGAVVVSRKDLARAVHDVLREKATGTLRLSFLSREDWARRWKESLG
ncbi:MAG: glycosyltransferase [Candidatus Paceibacterota bacterium]